MEENFKKRNEEKELVKKYESFRENKEAFYFTSDEYESIIQTYLDNNKHRKALKATNLAIEQYPYAVEFMVLKAQVYSNLQEYGIAIDILEKAGNLHPGDSDIFLIKGNIQILNGDINDALASFNRALEQSDDKDEIYYSIGLAYQNRGDYKEAISYFKRSLEENLNNENALYELAYCLDVTGELETSISYYKEFIDKDPYSEYAWFNLGIVYNKLEKYEDSINAYEYCLAIDEKYSSAYFNMGNSLMMLKKYEQGLNAFKTTLELEGPTPEIYFSIGSVYEQMEQYDLAIRYYRKSTKLDQFYDEAWYCTGICLGHQNKWYEAVHFFNKALKLSVENADYWMALAEAEYKVGNVVSSIDAYDEVSQLDPGNQEVWKKWSMIYHEQGDHEQAMNIIHDGLEELPDEASLFYQAVIYLIEKGQYKLAFTYLEKGLFLDYEGHTVLYDHFPKLETQKALYKIIQQYK